VVVLGITDSNDYVSRQAELT